MKMFISVIIPTYNRLPILKKCLFALENQQISSSFRGYEVVLVDDGSTDGTPEWIKKNKDCFPHLELFEQRHGGPAEGRNKGVEKAIGDVIIFIDSDLIVTSSFLQSHAEKLIRTWEINGNKRCFTYGAVINTSNFDEPTLEKYKISDLSWAYFATGNVAIDKKTLELSGLFDTSFRLYGWEDLELGERLRSMNVKLIKCPEAKGYHWHPSLNLEQLPDLIRVEKERAKMGIIFYLKHPSLRVRFIIQFTIFHRILWFILSLGGLINQKSIKPILRSLIRRGYPGLAMELLRIPLNSIFVREIYKEAYLKGLI